MSHRERITNPIEAGNRTELGLFVVRDRAHHTWPEDGRLELNGASSGLVRDDGGWGVGGPGPGI